MSTTDRTRTLDQKTSQLSSILVPLLELGGLGFAAYVFVYSIAIQYLHSPAQYFQDQVIVPRKGTAIGLIVGFCVLLMVLLLSWMRLLQVIWTNPGIVPVGNPDVEKVDASTQYFENYLTYISDYEGRPQYCDKCSAHKPDRTHHCRELNRCVRRMDHYCPWAGGIISETTHKFFIQFLFYGMLFMVFMLVPVAIFLAERNRVLGDKPPTWIALAALSGIFTIFTGAMFFMTVWNVTINYTTVETVQRGGVHNIAMQVTGSSSPPQTPPRRHSRRNSSVTPPNVIRQITREDGREYIVIQTQPFDHPWDLGSWANFTSIMGHGPLEWFIPLKMSPCAQHTDVKGEYPWGRVVLDLAAAWEAENPRRRVRLLSDVRRRGSSGGSGDVERVRIERRRSRHERRESGSGR
ncbi:zf-DHHC-domain-containing protein [Lentithecium fluviatile CBS 122367]|uniref:Palmitoyltransferase n=1 Tax=Lentithecium fluviatile CBS 122367 TaxID=1168545 RepID=A0A6G1IQH7_9PLEO|nr:zf-DHHC-domain-containing protein [Lentithecium fluviatile CBS 122367]